MITLDETRQISHNGVWKQNPGVVQILGMCPTLAMTTTVVNGASLGIATALVMLVSGAAVASMRQWVPHELRNPVYILIIAALVTMLELAMNAYMHGLFLVLGIFIPLIVTNCLVLARAEAFAAKNGILQSGLDGFMMGIGATLVLALLGGIRELLGNGTLFTGLDLVFGPVAKNWVIHVVPAEWNYQFLLSILPPGAFIGLGFLVAGKAWLDNKKTAPDASCASSHSKS